jgi:hypothetical protein
MKMREGQRPLKEIATAGSTAREAVEPGIALDFHNSL